MKTKLQFDYIWIPSSLGGHSSAPYEGMKTTIRWQKYLSEFIACARDVQWETFSFDSDTFQGHATCSLVSDMPLPAEWLKGGELIELLSGFRVLAVGRLSFPD